MVTIIVSNITSEMDVTASTVGRARNQNALIGICTQYVPGNLNSGKFAMPKGVTSLSQSFQRFELDKNEEELEKMQEKLEATNVSMKC